MLIVPRSSTGIKLGLRLLNTIGIIDADYYLADNEGHIMLFMENTTDEDSNSGETSSENSEASTESSEENNTETENTQTTETTQENTEQ